MKWVVYDSPFDNCQSVWPWCFCLYVLDAWAALEKGGEKREKQSWKKEFDRGICLYVFQMPTCPNLPWKTTWRRRWYDSPALRLAVRDALPPGCWTLQASNSAIRVGFYLPSLTLQASNSAVRVGFYPPNLTLHVNKSRFLSAQPDAASFKWRNKSRFLSACLMLQALNSAVRVGFFYMPRLTLQASNSAIWVSFYPPGLTLQVNKSRFLSTQPDAACFERCNKSRFYLPGLMLQALNSAVRVGFYPPSLTLQASNSKGRFLST